MISIQEIKLPFNHEEKELQTNIAEILNIDFEEAKEFTITKRAIDSRSKRRMIYFVYSVSVELKNKIKATPPNLPLEMGGISNEMIKKHRIETKESYIYEIPARHHKHELDSGVAGRPKIDTKKIKKRPIVVGSGPAGLFSALLLAKSGLKPLVIERGGDVDTRIKDVETFMETGKLNTESNIQFGEGGAGTFSDGKLNTLITNPRIKYIFDEFVKAGAPESILWDAKPHIGTDKIRNVAKNIREQIIKLGGEFRFNTTLTNLNISKEKLESVILNNKETIETDTLILVIGYSARDTYKMLYENKLDLEQKPFSIGVRIEHKAEMINQSQYAKFYQEEKLGTARYKLVSHSDKNRSVYSFCMCPGGFVMPATSEVGCIVTNGMSEYAQDGENSNSALLVNVKTSDFESDHPLAGIEFQKKWEKKAFDLGGRNFNAPAQTVGDFLKKQKSHKLKSIKPTYKPDITLTSLDRCLPDFVAESLREALPKLNNKIDGFSNPGALLTGIETRSSSPLRITRDKETKESNIKGIYPAGEGAGYAGGIVSSAIDGIMVSETILNKI